MSGRPLRWPPLETTLTREELVARLRAYFQSCCALDDTAERPPLRAVVAVLEEATQTLGLTASDREEILGSYRTPEGDAE